MDARYRELAKRIGLGNSERIPRLFAMLADSDESDLLLALPGDAHSLAEKLGRPEEEVAGRLQELFVKGVIFPSFKTDPPSYRMARDMIQFHDATILWPAAPREFLDLWQEWTEIEWPPMAEAASRAMPRPGMRVIPVGVSVESDGKVLAFEDVKDIIENADELAVTNCTCRLVAHKCDRTLEACLQVNNAASYAIARGTGRRLTKEEALEIARKAEEEGLIHATFNQRSVNHVICNCCGCCCQFLPVLIEQGIRVVAPSRFQAEVDLDACNGCELCRDRCYVRSIEMAPRDGDEEDLVARVDPETCLGCGLCMVVCPTDAITMDEVRPSDFVPESFG
jgi:Pyruvate/2-oxoacid:ferredoxin oxidoreductase delta subunit/DNA-binding Lrp family transcriptional regulator